MWPLKSLIRARSCKLEPMNTRRACQFILLLSVVFTTGLSILGQTAEKPGIGSSSSRQPHSSSKLSNSGSQASSPDLGSVREGVYRNAAFGISYKIPYGWVQRTESMRDSSSPEPEKSYLLFATFERPPEATGDSVNSALVITAESLSEYPGMDQAVDYFDVVDEAATSKGFRVLNRPYEFPIGTKKLARGDYSKKIADDVTMYQGSLVMLQKGFVVSFTFIAGSEDELESLIMDLKLGTLTKR
jgi:hypothetical protein